MSQPAVGGARVGSDDRLGLADPSTSGVFGVLRHRTSDTESTI